MEVGALLRKYASLEVLEAWRVPAGATADRISKAAHRVEFDYEPRPGYLYVRSRMISSRTNDNHDTFPPDEIEKGYRSFLGKPVFVNHHNANHRRARGVIVAVALHRDKNPDGTPDTWVEGLHEIDAVRFPRLARAILAGKVNRTSMGVDVDWSTCSACGNKATSPAEYCRHLPALKGKKIRKRNQVTGKVEEKLIHEICAGLSFFENSLLVEEPADPTAFIVGKPDARGLGKAASKNAAGDEYVSGYGSDPRFEGVSLRKDAKGYYVATHRARSDSYDSPEKIPASKIEFIRSTGSRKTASLSGPHGGRLQGTGTCRENCTYGGTHCAVCGEAVKVNLHKTDINGGWHHHDGMKRDHPATPADPQGVMDSIPGQIARKDQARQQMREYMHGRFEQLSGGPLPQRPRGDEGQMPPDPFLASRRKASGEPPQFRKDFTHCANCGVPLLDRDDIVNRNSPGDWRHHSWPHLCMQCAIGPNDEEGWLPGTPGKAHPVFPANKGGYHYRPGLYGAPLFTDQLPEGYRPWGEGDNLRHSESSRKTAKPAAAGGDHPFFHKNPVSSENIVTAYHQTTADEKALGDRWYEDAHHVAKAISGGDAAKGAGVLSAYSVRTSWPVNMFNASRAFQGDPPGPGSGAMTVHQKPAMAILAGKHHSEVLKGPKTRAFAHLIEHGGDSPEDEKNGTHKVVIDRHAMSVAMGRRISDSDDAPLDAPQHYEHVAKAYRVAAHVLSQHYGRKISPHQVQAATWLGQIRKNQAEDSGGQGKNPAGGKGRVKREQNAREKWRQHHPHAHPGGIPEENMHHRGSRRLSDQDVWPADDETCASCGRSFGNRREPLARRNPHMPMLCMGCSSKASQFPDHQENPDLMGGGRRDFGEGDYLKPSLSMRRQAYGETRVPPQVDTLRMEECPVCGEHDVWSGDRCPVCGFIVPPSLFRDPDTSKAQQVREELDEQGEVEVGPDGQIGSGEDADDQLVHPDQVAPDGSPGVQGEGGPVPASDTDGQPPEDEEDELAPGEEPEDDSLGDPQAEQAEGEELEQEGEAEQEQGQELAQEGEELEQEGEEEQETEGAKPDLECPACGAHYATDVGAQPGTPCPACGMGSLQPVGGAPEGAGGPGFEEDPESEDEAEEDPQEGSESEDEDEGKDKMPGSKTASALQQLQAQRIAALSAENEVLRAQLGFLAQAAGVDKQLSQIRTAVLKRHADMLNPASPIPDPPQAPAPESTEQALAPEAMDDVSRPGTTPGANTRVPAELTTTSITPGVEIQTPPATNLVDVTAPIQGTNPSQDGGVPISQRRIETDVRIDPNPLKAQGPGIGGVGNDGTAFPWLLDGQQPQHGGQQKAASLEAASSQRTFASIRLAKLRIQAGLVQGGDELAVAERIEKDASLPTQLIEHEIQVLARVPQAAPQQQRPMQRAAARQAPSLASVGATAAYAPAYAGDYDDASDIFLS